MMATVAGYLFWASLFLVAYTYILYPALLFLAYSLEQVRRDWQYLTRPRDRRCRALPPEALPAVSLIVPAYNEQACVREKIANIRELDYPPDKLEVIFVSDGSTDGTNESLLAVADPNVQVVLRPHRGKASALNHGVACARHDILVFTDTGTLFAPDALRKLVRHFVDPDVGVVCGALRFQGTLESQRTEGVYWRYESMLRLMEARLGATLGASGAIYALRRRCYRALAGNVTLDDFTVPMTARKLGYRVLYDPEAVGTDVAEPSVVDEFARRVRLAVGSFRALGELLRIPFHPFTVLAFVSHKLLRWIFPFLLIALLASNLALWSESPLYQLALLGQLLFYLWGAVGFAFRQRLGGIRYALLGYYLLAIHLAYLVGFVRFLAGQDVTWKRVSELRQSPGGPA